VQSAGLFLVLPVVVTGLTAPLKGRCRLIFRVPYLAHVLPILLERVVVVGPFRLGLSASMCRMPR